MFQENNATNNEHLYYIVSRVTSMEHEDMDQVLSSRSWGSVTAAEGYGLLITCHSWRCGSSRQNGGWKLDHGIGL
jgi:hypothetical protein